jgi:hypothetical protein
MGSGAIVFQATFQPSIHVFLGFLSIAIKRYFHDVGKTSCFVGKFANFKRNKWSPTPLFSPPKVAKTLAAAGGAC